MRSLSNERRMQESGRGVAGVSRIAYFDKLSMRISYFVENQSVVAYFRFFAYSDSLNFAARISDFTISTRIDIYYLSTFLRTKSMNRFNFYENECNFVDKIFVRKRYMIYKCILVFLLEYFTFMV